MTPQQIAGNILDEFTDSPDLYPNLGVAGNISDSVVALSTSAGVTITVTISTAIATTAHIEVEHGASLVRAAVFTDFSQEGLVDATVGYIARVLHQLNIQAAA